MCIVFDELENINFMLKRKGYWLEKLENNKFSLVKKILIWGYFSIDFFIKKIKVKLGDVLFFKEIIDFILK